jgi:hypothetical protein
MQVLFTEGFHVDLTFLHSNNTNEAGCVGINFAALEIYTSIALLLRYIGGSLPLFATRDLPGS